MSEKRLNYDLASNDPEHHSIIENLGVYLII
jgi:hypothetical protein